MTGSFSCRKGDENSRELNVEIHYTLEGEKEEKEETVVEMYHVR